jgi:hypothetical protein
VTGPAEDVNGLARCRTAVTRALGMDGGDAHLDAAVARLHRLPADLPDRSQLAAELLRWLVSTNPAGAPHRLRHIDGLLAIADRNPPAWPRWERLRSVARTLAILYAAAQGRLPDPGGALAELDELANRAGDDRAMGALFGFARTALTMLRAVQEGDETTLRRFPDQVAQMEQRFAGLPIPIPLLDVLRHGAAGLAANQRGDWDGARLAIDRVHRSASGLPPGHPAREAAAQSWTAARFLHRVMAGDTDSAAPVSDAGLAELAAIADRTDVPGPERARNQFIAGFAAFGDGAATDLDKLESSVERLRAAVTLTDPEDPELGFYMMSLALGLFRRSELIGTIEGLDEVTDLLERARQVLGGPHHPQWPLLNEMLSGVRQRLGQFPAARRSALEAQRGHAWRALLQADTQGAKIAIKDASRNAVDVARQCLSEHQPADALTALDSGRGLMLFAATAFRDVATRLTAANQPELARRWVARTSAGTQPPPEDLRREVLAALTRDSGVLTELLDPPDPAEIRSALATLDADALVYLVPGEPPLHGWAIIAPVDGPLSYLMLPNLVVARDADVEGYLIALSRDLSPPAAQGRLAGSLDALCDWAWRAAIGPLLERYVATRPAPTGRVPRLVLVPMGDLARIPWHAARRRDGRYAVELAAFSQAASARMLCESAARAPVPVAPVGLVVGDPDSGVAGRDLVAARREAYAIRQAYYRGARYLGRRPDGSTSPSGAGTTGQVRGWLADPRPAAGGMLHLACHGFFRADPDDAKAYLQLARDDSAGASGTELDAEELVDSLVRQADRQLALVVLAACNTGRSIHGYDEAYSLGTAFLAGGARSVLSTQWSIPDDTTSSLMFMFHHFLRRKSLPPWRALREAQLWMLDPDRRPPAEMPPDLRPGPAIRDPAHVVGWAGFVHWGQ